MEDKTMVWLSILLAALGGIIVVIGISLFRYYSGKQSQTNFTNASTERQVMMDSLNMEFSNTINEMRLQGERFNNKLEVESDKILTDLSTKSKAASLAIDNLKKESDKATERITSDLNILSKTSSSNQKEILDYVSTDSPIENIDNFITNTLNNSLVKSETILFKYYTLTVTESEVIRNSLRHQQQFETYRELIIEINNHSSLIQKLELLASKTKDDSIIKGVEYYRKEYFTLFKVKSEMFRKEKTLHIRKPRKALEALQDRITFLKK